jgi:putative acetyltransferase
MAQPFRRRRFVSAVGLNWLNLTRLELEVYSDNEPGLRLYKKFGFEIEGLKKKFTFRAGQYVDAYAMARLH